MNARPEVLCVGHDPVLNRTRRLILQRFFTVTVASDPARAISAISERPFHLVLICYSVGEQDMRAMVDLIRRTSPKTRTLVLSQHGPHLQLQPPDEEFVSDGPARLLEKAASMVGISWTEEAGGADSQYQ